MSLLLPSCFLKRAPFLALRHALPSLSSPILHVPRTFSVCASSSLYLSPRYYSTSPPPPSPSKDTREHAPKTSSKNIANYTFHTGTCSIPHPSKVKKGGEDAHFTSSDNKVIGVADGVGGWSEVGIDPAQYSKALMEGAKNLCEENIQKQVPHDPKAIVMAGWNHAANITGSSTCCVCALDGLKLKAANLGDSGFTIIRNGKVFFSSEPQQHGFNFPFQLGSQSTDRPENSDLFEKSLQVGDIIVAATDGVYDNISPETIAGLVEPTLSAEQLAKKIGKHARSYAEKPSGRTPFAIAASKHGYEFSGGKLDDITVVVGIVTE